MKIRAKMNCQSVTYPHEGAEAVRLSAVTSGSEENKTFSKFTPSASLDITITNPEAHGAFVEGKEYYVDFTPAEEETPAA